MAREENSSASPGHGYLQQTRACCAWLNILAYHITRCSRQPECHGITIVFSSALVRSRLPCSSAITCNGSVSG